MEPSEPPPPYETATASSSGSTSANTPATHLHPSTAHKTRNGIPPSTRRSMEDENRELPAGWVRQYDDKEHHQFFVDTKADPPRPIWHHPYDDEQYLKSLSLEERSRIEGLHRTPTQADIEAESSEDDQHAPYTHPELPPRPIDNKSGDSRKFGRKLKDKLTNSTHEEREAKRRQREEEERRYYEQHQKYRMAMSKAAQTGVPQFLGKDRDGKDVFIEPPYGPQEGYAQGAYGYNPYTQGPYANPNARFVRPPDPYARPYGYGYGGGLGAPLLGLGGGLLLGGLLF